MQNRVNTYAKTLTKGTLLKIIETVKTVFLCSAPQSHLTR
jgi:hypothetical protein